MKWLNVVHAVGEEAIRTQQARLRRECVHVNCLVCDSFLAGKNLHAKFCSAKCRQQHFRDQQKIAQAVEQWEQANPRYVSANASESVTFVPGTSPSRKRSCRTSKGGDA